jgi:hypothetical protein
MFVINPKIESINNISKKELKVLIVIKKSNGSRSKKGANTTAMILSIIQTLRYNKENVLHGMQKILKNASGY